RHRPLLPGLRLRRPGHHLRPDSRGPRHRRYPRGHRRTGGAELQERGRHSGGRRRHSGERGEDHLFPGGHGRLRRLQRGVRQVFHLQARPQLRGRARAAQGRALRDRGHRR
ncbi:Bacterial mobilisation domain-containing protein, partial [Dysosmobacter welbionis]